MRAATEGVRRVVSQQRAAAADKARAAALEHRAIRGARRRARATPSDFALLNLSLHRGQLRMDTAFRARLFAWLRIMHPGHHVANVRPCSSSSSSSLLLPRMRSHCRSRHPRLISRGTRHGRNLLLCIDPPPSRLCRA
eukprot:IDg21541t1